MAKPSTGGIQSQENRFPLLWTIVLDSKTDPDRIQESISVVIDGRTFSYAIFLARPLGSIIVDDVSRN